MQTDKETLAVLRAFNRNVEWLKMQSIKTAPPTEVWCDYEGANKIIPRSKQWYKIQRLGPGALLSYPNDWRMVGGRIEYKIAAVHNLKKLITR